ncbi:small ribosomal subunit protein uS9m [Lepeophtheirus salmonis]|uniref:28S ribosomal protein S9, mitochondrial n=2 Tax=Lepeophtheirus salmonis TaxID=72036 RepID=A0A0K2TW04_LEPSM|nr:28S ribosomal protein S9, mitochondrial-like [Lepeophtheirus salmonis]
MFLRRVASLGSSTNCFKQWMSSQSVPEISSAMKYYLVKKRNHDAFIAGERESFERGKANLAKMMGIPIETLSQEEIDRAIEYLFPSGLHNPEARPILKPPEEIFPKEKDAEFDDEGRPFHSFFYCVSPNFVQTLHDLVGRLQLIQFLEDRPTKIVHNPLEGAFFSGSQWVSKEELQDTYLERISDDQYSELLEILERLSSHAFAYKIKDYLGSYRRKIGSNDETIKEVEFIQPKFDEKGCAYVEAIGQRKTSVAHVKVTKPGKGSFSIAHLDYPEDVQGIGYFDNYMDRHQIMFPLQLTRLLGAVDVHCIVYAGGTSGQAGAVRYALSTCLKSFVDAEKVDEMRLMGLLTQDIRVRERKRFGHVKSRKKPKFKKR